MTNSNLLQIHSQSQKFEIKTNFSRCQHKIDFFFFKVEDRIFKPRLNIVRPKICENIIYKYN